MELYEIFIFKATFPEELTRKEVQAYDVLFVCALLKDELTLLYHLEDFKGKYAYEMLQWQQRGPSFLKELVS
jgi:hypothetical protein